MGRTVMRLLRALGVAILGLGTIGFALTLVWRDLNEREWRIEDFAALEAAGLLERGLVPEYFPRSARAIHLVHDTDTTAARATFRYDPDERGRAAAACRRVARSARGEKYLCPPFERRTITLVLRADGSGRFRSRPDAL